MKIALVHDDLVQWGGAERVLSAICEVYPEASIYTSIVDFDNPLIKQNFSGKKITTSFMQKIPFKGRLYKALLPIYPIAFEQFDFSGFDIVISHTTRFAKSIITKPETLHICYCHTPPRFLWGFSGEEIPSILKMFLVKFRLYDEISAKRVDIFLAGSINAKDRIEKIYRAKSVVVDPFVDEKFFKSEMSFDGGYFLWIGRLNKYKRADLALEACKKMGLKIRVIGKGPEKESLQERYPGVEFFENVGDEMVVNLIAGCKGLIVTAEEDFGMAALEAQAMGKGVIGYGRGGILETVVDKKTGVFFENQNTDNVIDAIKRFMEMKILKEDCIVQAKRFRKEIFKKKFKENVEKAYQSYHLR